jgi:V8-like Glu-specific endopeptidase
MGLRSRLLDCIGVGVALLLAGCGGGFEAAKPDPNQIMWVDNPSLAGTAEKAGEVALPLPLPLLPGAPPPAEPFVQPPPDQSPLEPRNMGGAPKIGPFGAPQTVDPNTPPYTALGKLEFLKGGVRYWCTAQIVGDVLMTAGHCVFDTNTNVWNTNFQFKLGYDNGSYRQLYDWQCSAVYTGWAQDQYNKDYAFLKLRGSTTNALGMKTGLPVTQWDSVGYPGSCSSGYNCYGGQKLLKVNGNRGAVSGGIVQMTGNPFLGGSSGGAWLDGTYIIGVNSFGYKTQPTNMYGPLLDGRATALYDFVSKGCSGTTVPPGKDPRIASYAPDKLYIDTDTMIVSSGIALKKVAGKGTCPCPKAQEWILENSTDQPYIVGVQYAGTHDDPPKVLQSDTNTVRIEGKSSKSLGCTMGDKDGNLCPVSLNFSIASLRRSVQITSNSGVVETKTVAPDFCADQCLNNPGGGYCLPYGSAAKPILASLAGFVTDMLDKPASSNGVTVTKKEMIEAFGGDPDTEDVCQRSDFYKNNEDVRNDGIACITTTPKVVDLPGEARVSLRSPSTGQAQRITSTGGTGSAASFVTREMAPFLEFQGTNSDEINKLYGGKVRYVERRNGRLIITTENGCSVGDDAP